MSREPRGSHTVQSKETSRTPGFDGGLREEMNSALYRAVEHVFAFVAKDGTEEEIKVDTRAESAMRAHHQLKEGSGINEARLALVDTACTSCMRSKQWRIEYSKTLPEGFECVETKQSKVFHFADGSTTTTRAPVWKIPIFLGNRPGFVQSAEIPTGTTPLLLSIASLVALDAVLFMRKKVMRVGELQMDLELVETGTKHLAIRVAFDKKLTGVLKEQKTAPSCQSSNDDLFVYLGQEAAYSLMFTEARPNMPPELELSCSAHFGPRGIRADDKRGEISLRRAKELAKTMTRLRVEDSRTWVAIRREYSLAEQAATEGFTTTGLFEPFGGRFGTTRVAASEWGWTCSQVLDRSDGYDLLSKTGRQLLWNVLVKRKPFLVLIAFDCRIWSIMTNMNPEVAWAELRKTVGLQTLRLVRDVCRYQCEHGRFYLYSRKIHNPL